MIANLELKKRNQPSMETLDHCTPPLLIAPIVSPTPETSPSRHVAQAELQNNPPRRLRRRLEHTRHHAGRHQRPRHHQLDQLWQLTRSAAARDSIPSSFFCQCESVVILPPDLGGRDQTFGDGQQSGFANAMPAPVDRDGLEARLMAVRCAAVVTRPCAGSRRPAAGASQGACCSTAISWHRA